MGIAKTSRTAPSATKIRGAISYRADVVLQARRRSCPLSQSRRSSRQDPERIRLQLFADWVSHRRRSTSRLVSKWGLCLGTTKTKRTSTWAAGLRRMPARRQHRGFDQYRSGARADIPHRAVRPDTHRRQREQPHFALRDKAFFGIAWQIIFMYERNPRRRFHGGSVHTRIRTLSDPISRTKPGSEQSTFAALIGSGQIFADRRVPSGLAVFERRRQPPGEFSESVRTPTFRQASATSISDEAGHFPPKSRPSRTGHQFAEFTVGVRVAGAARPPRPPSASHRPRHCKPRCPMEDQFRHGRVDGRSHWHRLVDGRRVREESG